MVTAVRRSLDAWEVLLRAHASLVRALDEELQGTHGLSLGDYDVLVTLAAAPGSRLRMRDLADRVLLSRSGITRRVDRLAEAGLVCREPATDDGRSIEAVLTSAGRELLRAAAATHLAGVEQRFLARYSPAELAMIAELLERATRGDAAACDAT